MRGNLPANCPKCGSQSLAINPGSGPRAARIDCEGCKRFVKWVSKADAQSLGLKLEGRAEK